MNSTFKQFLTGIVLVSTAGCLYESYPSTQLTNFKSEHKDVTRLGQVRFVFDDLGSLTLKGLMETRTMPTKVYETALLIAEGDNFPLTSESVPYAMEKYGFILPKKIANWKSELAPEPKIKVLGYVSTNMEKKTALGPVQLQSSTLSCAACHAGRTYDAKGFADGGAWLGSANTSIDFDSYLGQIYKGLKYAASNNKAFLEKIRKVFPDVSETEMKTIKRFIMPSVNKEIKKMAEMDRVLPFSNGGPGNTNGLSAFKRAAKLYKHPYRYKPNEMGFVSVQDINYRPFRSSLLADGSYGINGKSRYREMSVANAFEPEHIKGLAQLTAFFTFSAMGNSLKNVEPNIVNVEEIFRDFLVDSTPPRFPGKIDEELATRGQVVFSESCAKCHGQFEGSLRDLKLVSFPNKIIPFEKIRSDNYRWFSLDDDIKNFANKNKIIRKYVAHFMDQKGYVAPILSGLWATAPYMHNGSVPDLWSFMNPSLRPERFRVGGHALDFEKVGISYPEGYEAFANSKEYITTLKGRSNTGHEAQFEGISQDDKKALLEFLKLL